MAQVQNEQENESVTGPSGEVPPTFRGQQQDQETVPEPQIIVQMNEIQDAAAEALGAAATGEPGDALSESVLTQVTAQAFFQPVIEDIPEDTRIASSLQQTDVNFQDTKISAGKEKKVDEDEDFSKVQSQL